MSLKDNLGSMFEMENNETVWSLWDGKELTVSAIEPAGIERFKYLMIWNRRLTDEEVKTLFDSRPWTYSRVLTPEEIAALYNDGKGLNYPILPI
jgi:hypothetical protein